MSFIAFANKEASALRIYEKPDTVSIISEQPSYMTSCNVLCFSVNCFEKLCQRQIGKTLRICHFLFLSVTLDICDAI